MFSFTINGRRLSDDWEPFKFSHDQFPSQLHQRSKFFDESWFKELPIHRILEDEFPQDDRKLDEKDSAPVTKTNDVGSEPLSPGQKIQLGLHRPKLFDDPWFKDFLGAEEHFDKMACLDETKCTAASEPDAEVGHFKVTFEIGDFEPEEIDVSLNDDKLKVHGKKTKPGESHEMVKWYKLPKNINKDELMSSLSKDGLLHVTAPLKESFDAATKSDFQVEVPLADFKPENINVTINGRRLKVHAKKAGRPGHSEHEEVTRWFTLPETASTDGLRSSVDDDGSIVIQVPWASEESLKISGGEAVKADGKEYVTAMDKS